MADGDPPLSDSGAQVQSGGQAPPGDAAAAAYCAPETPAPPAPNARRKAAQEAWTAHVATWPHHLGNAVSQFGRWLSQLGKSLAKLTARLGRLGKLRPTPLQTIAILGAAAILSVLGALTFPAGALGKACVVAFVPGICIALGILGTRWYSRQALDHHLRHAIQNAVNATLHLKRSVRYVDDRLSEAQSHLNTGNKDGALIDVVRAKTATELSLGAAEQAATQWESLGGTGDPTLSPTAGDIAIPAIPCPGADSITGSVARVEDQHSLIINRGSEHGVKPDMVFAVMADGGDQIVDPETGQVIGELPTEKLRVKVVEVQQKYARATTFRTFTPARLGRPALTGFRLASGPETPGPAFDAIDESITRMLETELAEPIPVREAIANAKPASQQPVRPQARVEIGDRVRLVH